MKSEVKTLILRHRKENLKKCSLKGLEARSDFSFYSYPQEVGEVPSLDGKIVLTLDAPVLTFQDRTHPLFIFDGTWKYAEKMFLAMQSRMGKVMYRSIPSGFVTAYPRKQEDCSDPSAGLASIEAIYIAYIILGHKTSGLLDHYYWGKEFLSRNKELLSQNSLS